MVQIQTYVHGPVGHGDVEIDAKDNSVFVTTSFVSAWGLYLPNVLYVYQFDPLGSGKAVSQELYFDGPTAKYRNYTSFQAWLADGFVPPEPPPLPAAPCQFSPVPPLGYMGCTSMFGSPSNTPAELANIAAFLAHVDNFFTLNPDEPATVAAFLGRYNLSSPITRRSGFSTAQPNGD